MNKISFIFILLAINSISAFCGGIKQKGLVNIQEIELDPFNAIEIRYRSEDIVIFKNSYDKLIIKEYMTENNSNYYAKIINSGNELVIEAGRRPNGISSIQFRVSVEVYIPVSNKNIKINTSSGRIEGNDEYIASSMSIESSSGDISINSFTTNKINLKTSSGSINCKNLNGNTTIETSSGDIVCLTIDGDLLAKSSSGKMSLEHISGSVNASTSSGSIYCTITENAGDITIKTSSGSVTLDIPRDFEFNFSSRTSSGKLYTPFSDKLFSPYSDRDLIQGVITGYGTPENQINKNIDIRTGSGSIRINWID